MTMIGLKNLMKKRPVFGLAFYSHSVPIVEIAAHYGFDYLFIDAEHSPIEVTGLRELILAAENAGISALVRVTAPDEVEIRKALEMGAEGVIIPHVKTREDMELCVRGAKFPPLGRRGYDAGVHSARYGSIGYDSTAYIEGSNRDQFVLPMAEDFEFIDNIDEILSVPGVDGASFGPADFALSKNIRQFYKLDHPEVNAAFDILLEKTRSRGQCLMVPAVPPSYETAKALIDRGVRMLTMGNDLLNLQTSLLHLKETVLDRYA